MKTISYVNQEIISYRVSVSRACIHGCNGMLLGFSRHVMVTTNQWWVRVDLFRVKWGTSARTNGIAAKRRAMLQALRNKDSHVGFSHQQSS